MPAVETDLAALRAAFSTAARSVRALSDDAADDLALLRAVVSLDEALAAGSRLVAEIPALLAAAEPGVATEDAVHARAAAQQATARQVAALRARLDAAAADGRRLGALADEHAELTRRVDELTRAQSLADELPALRAQRDALAARTAAFAEPALAIERAIELAAHELGVLTTAKETGLRAEVTAALAAARDAQLDLAERLEPRRAQLADADREVTALRAELAGLDGRAAELAAERAALHGRLRSRLAANRRVAGTLGDLHLVDRRLDEADRALADALTEREAAQRAAHERRYPGGA